MRETDCYLFLYDIRSAKRMRQVVKALSVMEHGRLQKSVYEVRGSQSELIGFFNRVGAVVDKAEDLVMLVPLCEDDERAMELIGKVERRAKVAEPYVIV